VTSNEPVSPSAARPALFTPPFFVMCSFTFTVFLSAFILFPTMPFRIVGLGGSRFAAGLFLGFLTYASALSAPVTGALADRLGKRRVLVVCGAVLTSFSVLYAVTTSYTLPLVIAVVHGLFWSGLLSASAAHMTDLIPESRRAEGIAYWGLSTILAIAIAPPLGLWLFHHGWTWVCAAAGGANLVMTGIAWTLRDVGAPHHEGPAPGHDLVDWRVMKLAFTLFLYSFGYGGITSFSALYADSLGVTPKSVYFTALAAVMIVSRPLTGPLADRVGPRRLLLPCLVLIAVGLAMLPLSTGRNSLVASAIVFGSGFGSAYTVFVAHVMKHVDPRRRGAAFGGILAAFDTGIGTGSISIGYLAGRFGFGVAFGVAALLAGLSLPYFLAVERRLIPEG
jgi:MFS family permease